MVWNIYLRRLDNGHFLARFDRQTGPVWTPDFDRAQPYRSLSRIHDAQRYIKVRTRVVSDHDIRAEIEAREGGDETCLRRASGG